MISSTQGGRTILSSEGRYMGAAAWGQNDRLTNPYYRQLRQLFYFGNDGQVYLNRTLANWPRGLELRPYKPGLAHMIGPPIPLKKMWNPDAVLRPDDIEHAEITQERLDKAAATQLVFEDVLFHVIGHLIRTTGSNKLVLTGGTALNGIANMRLGVLDEHQPVVSNLLRGKISQMSIEKLLIYADRLGLSLDIRRSRSQARRRRAA